MEKEFEVKTDITMSGSFYIRANSEEEAMEKIREKHIVAYDLRSFCCIHIEPLKAEEVTDA